MPDQIVYVVVAPSNPGLTEIFRTEKEAEQYCKEWFPDTVRIMNGFYTSAIGYPQGEVANIYERVLPGTK